MLHAAGAEETVPSITFENYILFRGKIVWKQDWQLTLAAVTREACCEDVQYSRLFCKLLLCESPSFQDVLKIFMFF